MSSQFDNVSKPRNRPFSFRRVNSRNFKPKEPPPNGKGYDCGCRNPAKDYSQTGIADILAKGMVDALGSLIPKPVRVFMNNVLRAAAGTDLDELQDKLSKFISNTVEGFIFAQALRSIPAWVPVNRDKFDPKFKEEDKEIEGHLTRSFQSCTDLPVLPWSRFYNWNFHVRPEPGNGYEYVMGRGNELNDTEVEDLGGRIGENQAAARESFDMVVNRSFAENSLECVWDTGAFSRAPGNVRSGDFVPGVMFHPRWPFWPMTNDHFWAQGRWVYDCTHVKHFKLRKQTPEGEKVEDEDRMWTQLHPCRAMACYRYEGFKFDENEKAVPASRFLFFACRKGGYHDFQPFSELDPLDDPQFIVDLPDPPAADVKWPIGHTLDFPANTVVIRPRLLMKMEFGPFGVPGTFFPDDVTFHSSDPGVRVELVRSANEVKTPDQVRVTIPLSKLPKEAIAFGVCISLGWFDPAGALAERVKKVSFKFDNLRDLDKSGELRFKLCVNGHWVFMPLHDQSAKNVPIGDALNLLVPDDAKVALSVHGTVRHGYGEFMETKTDKERRLRVGGLIDLGDQLNDLINQGKDAVLVLDGKEIHFLPEQLKELLKSKDKLFGARRDVDWKNDVDQPDKEVASAVARELFFSPFPLTNRKDEPLGLVDAEPFNFEASRLGRADDGSTVAFTYEADRMSDLVQDAQAGKRSRTLTLLAHQTRVVGDAHMLGHEGGDLVGERGKDYLLQCTITVEDQ
jgi:hypothetical protein